MLLLTGCHTGEPELTEIAGFMPEQYSGVTQQANVEFQDKWWQEFGSEELNNLVASALSDNLSIEQAWARLKQAKAAELKINSADDLQVDLSAGAGTSRSRSQAAAGTTENTTDSYSLGLAAAYELDLWGRIDSQKQAALLSVQASRESVDAAATTVVAEIVQTWLDILASREQKSILNKQLETNKSYLELLELRFNMSSSSSLDVLRQRQTVEQVKAALILAESSEKVAQNKLAALLGKMPGSDEIAIKTEALPQVPDTPDTGIPSQLLIRRPDLRLAMVNIKIANWNLSEAKADKLPAFKLTASYKYGDDELESLFDNWIMNLAANLTVPLLDGNRREAEISRVQAVIEEKTSAYKQTAIAAITEVTNAMLQEQYQQKNIDVVTAQLELARQALKQAEYQYFNGAQDYLSTLSELIKVQALELEILSRQKNLLQYRTALYRALGGSWLE
ncbi:MAG: TolC family protein [Sedimentisphaerales bacterium]|nr:TolC family protein [Sedimentisphaerales bacterium]